MLRSITLWMYLLIIYLLIFKSIFVASISYVPFPSPPTPLTSSGSPMYPPPTPLPSPPYCLCVCGLCIYAHKFCGWSLPTHQSSLAFLLALGEFRKYIAVLILFSGKNPGKFNQHSPLISPLAHYNKNKEFFLKENFLCYQFLHPQENTQKRHISIVKYRKRDSYFCMSVKAYVLLLNKVEPWLM